MTTRKAERGEVSVFDACALNEDYEMVEGEWVFQFRYRAPLLLEQTFT